MSDKYEGLKLKNQLCFPLYVCAKEVVNVTITEEGEQLKEKAVGIPAQIGKCVPLEPEEAMQLYAILQKLLGSFQPAEV